MTTSNENNTEATAPGRRVHYCHCLGRWYGRAEWNRLRQLPSLVALATDDGYKYDYADRCTNPTEVVHWSSSGGNEWIWIELCHGRERWAYGLHAMVGDMCIDKMCRYPSGADSYATSDDAFVAAVTTLDAVLCRGALDAPAYGVLFPNTPSTYVEGEREQTMAKLQEIFGQADEIIARRQQG